MLLIAEIILTVMAWRAGWKWTSLIPIASSFILGLILGASGTDMDTITGIAIVYDIAVVGVLIGMIVKKKNTSEKEDSPETETSSETDK